METLKFVAAIARIVSSVFVCIGVVIALLQLRADHERRKKQATIEYYTNIRKEFYKCLNLINIKFGKDMVINVKDVKDNNAILNAISEYLSYIERLSVGINTKVYSDTVFERMSKIYTIRWYYRLREIILYFRKPPNNPIAYKDFEDLVYKLIDIRKKRFPKMEQDLAKMKFDFG